MTPSDAPKPASSDPRATTIDRDLADGEREGTPTRVATVSRSYPTSPQDLWEAVTVPDRIGRWFTPVTGDLTLGGHYQLQDNASGTITACDPPRSFSATWEFGGGVSWITVTVEPHGDDARLTIEHSAPIPDEGDDFWDTYGPGAVGVGWDLGLLGLSLHVAAPGLDRVIDDEEEWARSADGTAFITASSAAWAEASIDFGTDRESALAAGERTTAFYLGS